MRRLFFLPPSPPVLWQQTQHSFFVDPKSPLFARQLQSVIHPFFHNGHSLEINLLTRCPGACSHKIKKMIPAKLTCLACMLNDFVVHQKLNCSDESRLQQGTLMTKVRLCCIGPGWFVCWCRTLWSFASSHLKHLRLC